MLMPIAGSIGVGLVWGWLTGSLGWRLRRPIPAGLALGGATGVLAGGLGLLVGWAPLPYFIGAALLALLLHLGWRQALVACYGLPGSRR